MTRTLILVAACTFALSAAAHFNTMPASNLLKVCTAPSMDWIDFCNGFFQAVHDNAMLAGKVCTGAGLTHTNLVMLYERGRTRVIRSQSEVGELTAMRLATAIFEKYYPCR